MFAPIREASARLTDDEILAVLKAGADRVRPRITATLEAAKRGMGL